MSRIICVFLALFMLFSLFGAAEADSPAFTIDSIEANREGLKVSWSDPNGNAPYKVLFQPVTAANEERPTGDMVVWCNSGEVNGTEYLEPYTLWAYSWWFIVEDSTGNQVFSKYEGNQKNFDDAFRFDCEGQLQLAKKGKSSTDFTDVGLPGFVKISVQDVLAAEDGEYYGLRLNISVSKTSGYNGTMMLKYVLEAGKATGYVAENTPIVAGYMTDSSKPLVFNDDHRSNSLFVNLSGLVKTISGLTDDYPGIYDLVIYADGQRAWTIPLFIS